MTLILNLLAGSFVLQVSDRRVTEAASGGLVDDDRNKAVLWQAGKGIFSFAITGLADLDGEQADIWLARRLIEGAQNAGNDSLTLDILNHVADSATVAMKRVQRRFRKTYPHTFVGAGWLAGKITGDDLERTWLIPSLCVITNVIGPNEIGDQFRIWWQGRLPGQPPKFSHFGQDLSTSTIERIMNQGQRVLRRNPVPAGAARILQADMLAIAKRNSRVGSNLMVNCIPIKSAAEHLASGPSISVDHSTPNHDSNSFLYVSKNLTHGYGPRVVVGNRYLGDITYESPMGANPLTGTLDLTEGSITMNLQLPDPPEHQAPRPTIK